MDPVTLSAIIAMLEGVVPSLTSSAAIQAVIDGLIKLIPIVAKTLPQMISNIKLMISMLSSNDAATPEQLAQLEQLSAQSDAEFDAALAAARAADQAAEDAGE